MGMVLDLDTDRDTNLIRTAIDLDKVASHPSPLTCAETPHHCPPNPPRLRPTRRNPVTGIAAPTRTNRPSAPRRV